MLTRTCFAVNRKAARILLTMDENDSRRLFEGKSQSVYNFDIQGTSVRHMSLKRRMGGATGVLPLVLLFVSIRSLVPILNMII